MNKKYTIHEVAELLGLSSDAIRLYEKEGLVKAHRNPENRYRFYDKAQIQRIMVEKTAQLKEMNTVIVDNNNNLSSTSEEVSASAEETTAMCADNVERFKVVNNVISQLTEDAGKMDVYIQEYDAMQEN